MFFSRALSQYKSVKGCRYHRHFILEINDNQRVFFLSPAIVISLLVSHTCTVEFLYWTWVTQIVVPYITTPSLRGTKQSPTIRFSAFGRYRSKFGTGSSQWRIHLDNWMQNLYWTLFFCIKQPLIRTTIVVCLYLCIPDGKTYSSGRSSCHHVSDCGMPVLMTNWTNRLHTLNDQWPS